MQNKTLNLALLSPRWGTSGWISDPAAGYTRPPTSTKIMERKSQTPKA